MNGNFTLLDVGEDCLHTARSVVAFERSLDGSHVRCAVNLGPESHALKQADLLKGEVLYGGLEGDRLPPFSGIVLRCKN